MKIGLGFFCSTSDSRLSTNHKLRLSNLSRENLLKVFHRNLRDLIEMLKISKSMGLTIFRLGSNFVPFASHSLFRDEWRREIESFMKGASKIVLSYGVRLTMHPGQYVVLNSPRRDVVERSLNELRYHFWVLDSLGVGREGVVVVHVGGAYGSKPASLKRLGSVIEENKWLTRRLALENDERHYTVADVIEFAESYGIPVVFDYYHHVLNPSRFDADRLIDTWSGVTPEMHISSKPSGEARFGEHGDYVDPRDFIDFMSMFNCEVEVDVIVEAKKKEIAIRRLLEDLRDWSVEPSRILRRRA